MPRALPILLIALFSLSLQGCGVYFNTMFNAEKAYKQALKLRAERLAQNPDDTVSVAPEERTKLIRAVTKSSKVLELWPNGPKYAPRAVFLIAESQLRMEDYGSAALKYDEYIRYFPKEEKVPLARVRMARALYLDGKRLAARDALADVMAGNPRGEVRREALLLSARMRVDEHSGSGGLALYEQLLAEGSLETPEARNEARWRAAQLAFDLGEWEKARAHALAAGEGDVPSRTRFRNRRLAVRALYHLGRYAEGLAEVRTLRTQREYRAYRPELKLLEAQGVEGAGDWPEALGMYREAARLGSRTAVAAEAWYRIGEHVLDIENDEVAAVPFFDSAAAAGGLFDYAVKGAETASALRRLAELRAPDTTGADSGRPHYRGFMIAEIFHFRLVKPDSARVHLNRIVADDAEDTTYSRRAFYALAWLEENTYEDKARADSLYRVLLARYPGTEWAKQAEKNLGLPPTVVTRDDRAHALFLEAENRRIAGGSAVATAVPSLYRAVLEQYPGSRDAAKAQFVLAFLTEQRALAGPPGQPAVDTVKAAYEVVRDNYPGTPHAEAAETRISALDAAEEGGGSDPSAEPAAEEELETGDESRVPRVERLDPTGEQDLY